MEITSPSLSLGRTCPGPLLQSLLDDHPSQVAGLTNLQLSFASALVTYQCPVSCPDLRLARRFITSVDALVELSVLHYDGDDHLWPAVFHHAKSLRSLSIHTPPKHRVSSPVWAPEAAARVVRELAGLERLEVDVPLEEAEGLVTRAAGDGPSGIVDEVAKSRRLKSLLVSVSLGDEASSFAAVHLWNAMGSVSFPKPEREVCDRLARAVMAKFPAEVAAMREVEVRIARRCWDDRAQFRTLGYTVQVRRDDRGNVTVEPGAWKEYLPAWPEYGGYVWGLAQRER